MVREQIRKIFQTALRAVHPGELLQERLKKIPKAKRLFVVGGGKAAAPMAKIIEEFYLDRITSGCIAVKEGYGLPLKKIEALEAGHPTPDERSVRAAGRILKLLEGLGSEDVVIALISGGASSLLALPKMGTVSELASENDRLLASGLPIQEINRKRRELTVLADGGLAQAASPAKVVSFILSDVMGNDLLSIGSGPTVLDPPEPDRVQNFLIGDNALAVGGAVHGAQRFGYKIQVQMEPFTGEAVVVGREFAKSLLQQKPKTALIGGGEATVRLGSTFGKGGRCQESALAAAIEFQGKPNVTLLFAGTDGSDGPTDAAGAFVDGTTVQRAEKLGLDPSDFLRRHDSHTFFSKIGDLFQTGPTFTNVADLAIGLVA